MASKVTNLKLLRSLIRELRRINGEGSVRNHPMYAYTMEQYRRYQVTDKKFCRDEDELVHMANTYLCLLESTRKGEEISSVYNKGERSVEEAAKLVGLQLPKEYSPKGPTE